MLVMKSNKSIRDEGETYNNKRYPFRQVENDMSKCMECGMIVAKGEKYIHGAYHKRFTDTYNEHEEMVTEYVIEKYMRTLKGKRSITAEELQMLEELEFTTTLRSGDYAIVHPTYGEYITLLWNTPEFKKELKALLTEELYAEKVKEHSSNRCLRVIGDFSFMSIKVCKGDRDVSHLDRYGLQDYEPEGVEEQEEIEYIIGIEDEYLDLDDLEEEEIQKVIDIENKYTEEDEDAEENPKRVEEMLKVINL